MKQGGSSEPIGEGILEEMRQGDHKIIDIEKDVKSEKLAFCLLQIKHIFLACLYIPQGIVNPLVYTNSYCIALST